MPLRRNLMIGKIYLNIEKQLVTAGTIIVLYTITTASTVGNPTDLTNKGANKTSDNRAPVIKF